MVAIVDDDDSVRNALLGMMKEASLPASSRSDWSTVDLFTTARTSGLQL